ncbi:MAG: NUDIX hydrolase, partial [Trebonia sp.]
MEDFGGGHFTTWDGEPVSRERPYGAMVVVASRAPEGWRYVLLHRVHAAERDGDWAWTPPSGARRPGEELAACAARELREETGLHGFPQPVVTDGADWAVFVLEIPWGTVAKADGTEHD